MDSLSWSKVLGKKLKAQGPAQHPNVMTEILLEPLWLITTEVGEFQPAGIELEMP